MNSGKVFGNKPRKLFLLSYLVLTNYYFKCRIRITVKQTNCLKSLQTNCDVNFPHTLDLGISGSRLTVKNDATIPEYKFEITEAILA